MKTIYDLMLAMLLIAGTVSGQDKNSQETAEKNALQRYESQNQPPSSKMLPAPAENESLFGARLVRTSTLLATSSKEYRQPVKVLIYGQSIVGSVAFTEELESQIRTKFPYADVSVENKAIGGFGGNRILRTAWHDIYPTYPDLIVFHVYGGEKHGELEQLFTNIRRYTTADIILMNHHPDAGRTTINENSFGYLRYIANKYDCELVDISTEWVQYLSDNHLDKKDLLRDNVHPNRIGSWLLAWFIVRHLQYNPLFPGKWYQSVQTTFTSVAYDKGGFNPFTFTKEPWKIVDDVPTGSSPKSTLKFTFYGNRVDIIAGITDSTKLGSARIKIDGKPVAENPRLYAITRPGRGAGGWFPAIMRIGNQKPLIPETWTLRMEQVNADSSVYHYSVRGSKTGFDGSGNTAESFISKSGRVVIEPSDFMFKEIKKTFKASMPVGFEINWTVFPLFKEVYRAPAIKDKSKVYKTTVVQGLTNGVHTIEIVPLGDGEVPIEGFEVHRPPLE